MPRYNVQVFTANPDGTYVDGAVVTVTGRNPATPVAVYALSSSVTAMATPILTVGGTTNFWVDDLIAYNLVITGTGFGSYTTYIEAVTAESVNRLMQLGPGGGGGGGATSTPWVYTGANKFSFLSSGLTSAMVGKTSGPIAWLDITNANSLGQNAASFTGLVQATPGIRFADGTIITSMNGLNSGPAATPWVYTGANTFSFLSAGLNSALVGKTSGPLAWLDVTNANYLGRPAGAFAGIVTATPGIKYPDGTYDVTASEVFRTTHTFAVAGNISTPTGESNFIPPFFISLGSRQTANIVKARYTVHNNTTPAIIQLQKNDQAILGYVTLPVTATPAETLSTVAVADNDKINLYVTSAVQSAPTNLTVTVVLEHTVL